MVIKGSKAEGRKAEGGVFCALNEIRMRVEMSHCAKIVISQIKKVEIRNALEKSNTK